MVVVEGGNVLHHVKGRVKCPGEYVRGEYVQGKCPDPVWLGVGRSTDVANVRLTSTLLCNKLDQSLTIFQ